MNKVKKIVVVQWMKSYAILKCLHFAACTVGETPLKPKLFIFFFQLDVFNKGSIHLIKQLIFLYTFNKNSQQITAMEETENITEVKKESFLQPLFQNLQKKKETNKPVNIPIGTVYKGFKTIPIQKLEPKKFYTKAPIQGQKVWKKEWIRKILHFQQNTHLSYEADDGFFQAVYDAYIQHGQLKITPDDVWLIILLYFTQYVNDHAEELRKAFVNHQGKTEVTLTEDLGKCKWDQILDKTLSKITTMSSKEAVGLMQSDFSTSTKFTRNFSTALIMRAYQKYYSFQMGGGICGITKIHMGGNQADWENLIKKLLSLGQFDVDGQLKSYINRLEPVLDQFLQTYKGHAHIEFWNNLYHQRIPDKLYYGVSKYINGWLIRFNTLKDQLSYIKQQSFTIPIAHNTIKGKKLKYGLVGGCIGVSVKNNIVYSPHFSLAFVEFDKQPECQQQ